MKNAPPPDDPFVSKFGAVTAAREGEEWPMLGGLPMVALGQINLTEAPQVPAILEGVRLITVFVSNRNYDKACPTNAQNGDGWVLRTYGAEDRLLAIRAPAVEEHSVSWWKRLARGKPFQLTPSAIRWELQDDYPDIGLVMSLCPEIEPYWDDHENEIEAALHNVDACKVGGWASYIQDGVFYGVDPEPEYAFQFASELRQGLVWGDMGIATFGLCKSEAGDTWFLDTNFT